MKITLGKVGFFAFGVVVGVVATRFWPFGELGATIRGKMAATPPMYEGA